MEYDEALDKAYENITEVTKHGERFEPPEFNIRVEGNSTIITNFRDVAEKLDRDENHLMKHVLGEIGTAGHLENRRARLKGEFSEENLQEALKTYIEKYVLCSECNRPDTRLEKQKGTLTLKCEACGAFSPVK